MKKILVLLASILCSASFALSPQTMHTLNNSNAAQLTTIIAKYERLLQQAPNAIDNLKILGIAYHNLAVIGSNANVAQKAFDCLQLANQLSGGKDAEIMAYWGSSETLIARDMANPFQKMQRANAGTSKIDQAVAMDNDNIIARMVRIENTQSLPPILGRQKFIAQDVNYLIALYSKSPAAFTPFEAAFLFCKAGDLSSGEDAKNDYQSAIKMAPQSKYADYARGKLK